MTTRDDLVSRLNAGCVFQYVGDGSDNQEVDTLATYATMQEAASALEAKDAEIAEWRQAASVEAGLRREFLARAEAAESRITDLKRQLAEETERCARIADDFGASAENKIESDPKSAKLILAAEANAAGIIAAAIRGGAK